MTGQKIVMKLSGTIPNSFCVLSLALLWSLVASCQAKKANFLSLDSIQLAPPSIQVDSALFRKKATVRMQLQEPGVVLRYSLNGGPADQNSSKYTEPIALLSSSEIRVKAFHEHFAPSTEKRITVRKLIQDISDAELELHPQPNASYPGKGVASLVDGQKGGLNFRNGHFWLGFQENKIELKIKLEEGLKANKLVVSILQDQSSWIFAPHSVEVSSNGSLVGSKTLDESAIAGEKQLRFIEVPIAADSDQELTILINSLQEIPEWHPGKGTLPWTFVDEIMIE